MERRRKVISKRKRESKGGQKEKEPLKVIIRLSLKEKEEGTRGKGNAY